MRRQGERRDRRDSYCSTAARCSPTSARRLARAATVTDAAGRAVPVPARVERVFPAGPPAAIMLYTLAPDLLLGWPRANRPEEREFLLPDIGARPEVGRLTGRGNTANLEVVLALKPDLILDIGCTSATYVSLADRVQEQTGIPYALLDGRFDGIAPTYRTLGALSAGASRARRFARAAEETICDDRGAHRRRPASGVRASITRAVRAASRPGSAARSMSRRSSCWRRNVAGATRGGLATVSIEQVLLWDPEVIVTIDQDFAAKVRSDPAWAPVAAVRDGRVHLSPKLPFGWVDFPPSRQPAGRPVVAGKILYPDLFPEDLRALTRDFYARFYHVTPTDAQIERVLAGRDCDA